MTDIEVKRKELETAKRIRAGGYFCGFGPGTVKCIEDCCPGKNESATECSHWQELEWDAFISTREAEIAALEETPTNSDCICSPPSEAINTAWSVCPSSQGKGIVAVRSDQWQGNYHHFHATGPGTIVDQNNWHGTQSYPVAPVGADMNILTPSPTLDDFALALIQGGYFNMTMGEDAAISNLVSRAEKIKAALDARRGA